MDDKRKGVVVFLDALGIKGVWNTNPNFIDKWETVRSDFKRFTKLSQEYSDSSFKELIEKNLINLGLDKSLANKITPRFNIAFFSDTVIITASVPHHEYTHAEFFIPFACHLLVGPFLTALKNMIFFRGSISVGNFYQSASHIDFDTTLTVGPAVDEAAEYYTLPNWVGISTAPSATLAIEQCNATDLSEKFFVRYDIPMKNGAEKNGFALAWPALENEPAYNETMTKHRQYIEINMDVKKFINKPLAFSVYSKLRNTLAFHDYISK
jgi:hypothetical protein